MNLPLHGYAGHCPRRIRWFLAIAWLAIVVKCSLVWWAIDHWSMTVNPWWIIAPTLMFATLVTAVVACHHDD